MDTVTLTVDGRTLTVEKGKTVLQAAIENGIDIPYFCYHPALDVDGSCRVCLVRIEKMAKLQTACSTLCADGMVVDTCSPEVTKARAAVLEFLLLNHPLDCPVCDKGGECPLQDFSYAFGPARSRTDLPRRVFDGDGVRADVDFGPTLLLNRNRCILCTRCVRFMREIDGDAQISIIDRGNGSQIATFEERGVHSLLSGNLMDVCPVGAITTRDYRFKSRPWDNLEIVGTICTSCAKGCNIVAWIKAKPEWAQGARLVRITPQNAPAVNGFWMCDLGRFTYHWIESDQRLRRPLVRYDAELQPAVWHEAVTRIRERLLAEGQRALAGLRFLVSAHASLEELFLVRELAARIHGAAAGGTISISWVVGRKGQPARTKFRVPAVDAPNVRGACDLGLAATTGPEDAPDLSALRAAVGGGRVPALYVHDPGPPGSIGDLGWAIEARRSGLLPLLIVHGVHESDLSKQADFVLPGATSFEKEACYVNDAGLVQGASRVLPPPGEALEDWQTLVNVAVSVGRPLSYTSIEQVRTDLAAQLAHLPGYAGLASLSFGQPALIRHWLQTSNPSERAKWESLFKDLPPVKFESASGEKLP